MQGLHLTADLHGCQCDRQWLTDADRIDAFGSAAVASCGLTLVGRLLHSFAATSRGPGGVTATFMLAESHVCLHTWPEQRAVTVDVYVCNTTADHGAQARELMGAWVELFQATDVERHELLRGSIADARELPQGG